MLFEVGILFARYVGFRLFEKHQSKVLKKPITIKIKKPKSLQLESVPQEKVIKKQVEKTHNHYLKVSGAFMGGGVLNWM